MAVLIPFLPVKPASREDTGPLPVWPEQFDGVKLKRLPLSEREEQFAQEFPGSIARFTDGEREIIIRWTAQTLRKFQPASDYLRRLDYVFKHEPFWKKIWKDQNDMYWGYFETEKPEDFRVLERIHDEAGNSWTDASSWYWAVLLGKTNGPWWIVTILENTEKE